MAISKEGRINILLAIDIAFFIVEILVGYAAHSLALIADAFHMLNDVLSLFVGKWAIQVARQKSTSRYTYGWQRAETLGALVNAVFLLALCLTIFLEAVQRLFEPQEVSKPVAVLIVGCLGLSSNILGLVLFHDVGHGHSHSHDESHSHSHKQEDDLQQAEEGRTQHYSDLNAPIANGMKDTPPKDIGVNGSHSTNDHSSDADFTRSDEDGTTAAASSPSSRRKSKTVQSGHHRRTSTSSRSRLLTNPDDIPTHPASLRNDIIAAARLNDIQSVDGDTDNEEAIDGANEGASEQSPLLRKSSSNGKSKSKTTRHGSWHDNHKHKQPKAAGASAGHSHGDLNMRGVFLHVMGDALGNIGVIASALFIWLTPFWWRFYADPLISLVITVIILMSAIPLCKATSRILLQAVPTGVDVEDIQNDIEELPGINSCHHLHVWQLSEKQSIATLHVQVGFDFKGEGSARYMALAQAIRQCLHEYGIHSSTIQPEFCLDPSLDPNSTENDYGPSGQQAAGKSSKKASRASSLRSSEPACLLQCGDECAIKSQCCAPVAPDDDKDNAS